jgi:hypothetical protein
VQDRFAKDLNVPWHMVSMSQYARWEASNFTAGPATFKLGKNIHEEIERLSELSSGSALRK